MAERTLFAVMYSDGLSYPTAKFRWAKPPSDLAGEPGEWMPEREVGRYMGGYPLFHPEGLVYNLGPEIWLAEGRGKKENRITYTRCSQARLLKRIESWTNRTIREFACDCAEHIPEISDNSCAAWVLRIAREFVQGKALSRDLYKARSEISEEMERQRGADLRFFTMKAAAAALEGAVSRTPWKIAGDAADHARDAFACYVSREQSISDDDVQEENRRKECSWQSHRLMKVLGVTDG